MTPADLTVPPQLEIPGQVEPEYLDTKDRAIVKFYRQYAYWVIGYSRILARGHLLDSLSNERRDEIVINAGFSVLLLLNPLIDLIGLLIGNDTDSDALLKRLSRASTQTWLGWEEDWKRGAMPLTEKTVSVGLDYFFGEDLDSAPPKVFDVLLRSMRHGLAHVSFPKQGIIVHHHLDKKGYLHPLMWGSLRGVDTTVAINVPLFQARIETRFYDYVSAIRYPRNNQTHLTWRSQFLDRIDHVFVV